MTKKYPNYNFRLRIAEMDSKLNLWIVTQIADRRLSERIRHALYNTFGEQINNQEEKNVQ